MSVPIYLILGDEEVEEPHNQQPQEVNAEELVTEYIRLRDLKEEKTAQADAERAAITVQMEEIEGKLDAFLARNNMATLSTTRGTVFRSTQASARVADRHAFLEFCKREGRFDLMSVAANKGAVKEFVEESGGALPDGLNYTQFNVIQIRRK